VLSFSVATCVLNYLECLLREGNIDSSLDLVWRCVRSAAQLPSASIRPHPGISHLATASHRLIYQVLFLTRLHQKQLTSSVPIQPLMVSISKLAKTRIGARKVRKAQSVWQGWRLLGVHIPQDYAPPCTSALP
jgi:hypothetical protein